jgi:hypothetical protein
MKNKFRFSQTVFAIVMLVCVSATSFAQDTAEIKISAEYTPGREKPIPLSISGFSG